MKLLLDQGLPRSAVAILCRAGVDTVHVGDIAHCSAEDSTILALARESSRVVITLDADFHALLAVTGDASPSVVRVRIEGLKGEALASLLLLILEKCQAEIESGAAVTVQTSRIRVRLLPLSK